MKKIYKLTGFILCLCLVLAMAVPTGVLAARDEIHSESHIQFRGLRHNDMLAAIETNMGTIHVVLYQRYAPLAVVNFTTLAAAGYYNGTSFHRVVQDFVAQGGDPTGTGTGGASTWNQPFKTETREGLRHYSGALCMAAAGGAADTNGSQFYFVVTEQGNITGEAIEAMREAGVSEFIIDMYNRAGGLPYLDYTDTVFGQVYDGWDVLEAIAAVATDSEGRPLEDVVVQGIVIDRYIDEEYLAAQEEEANRREEEEARREEEENNEDADFGEDEDSGE